MEMGRFMSRKPGKGALVRPPFLNDEAARRDVPQEFGMPVDGNGFIRRERSFQGTLYPDVFHLDGSCDQHRRLFFHHQPAGGDGAGDVLVRFDLADAPAQKIAGRPAV